MVTDNAEDDDVGGVDDGDDDDVCVCLSVGGVVSGIRPYSNMQ